MSAELKAQLEEINKNLLDKTEEIKKSAESRQVLPKAAAPPSSGLSAVST